MTSHGARTEMLMNVSAVLADLTRSSEHLAQVPDYLSRALGIEPLTLLLVRDAVRGPEIVLSASSGAIAQTTTAFPQDMLSLYQQAHTGVRDPGDGAEVLELDVPESAAFPRATVIAQSVEKGFRLVLVAHHRAGESSFSQEVTETLMQVAGITAKLFECLVIWLYQHETLGEPFNLLTQREWTVLRHLKSDVSEKVLADQLHLSPHTLHSHIKSIYRKTGVQGRLSLVLLAQEAMREIRQARIERKNVSEPGIFLSEVGAAAR